MIRYAIQYAIRYTIQYVKNAVCDNYITGYYDFNFFGVKLVIFGTYSAPSSLEILVQFSFCLSIMMFIIFSCLDLENLSKYMVFLLFHYSFHGGLQLGEWHKLSTGNWQCPHTKVAMQS